MDAVISLGSLWAMGAGWVLGKVLYHAINGDMSQAAMDSINIIIFLATVSLVTILRH